MGKVEPGEYLCTVSENGYISNYRPLGNRSPEFIVPIYDPRKEKRIRISRDQGFLEIAEVLRKRSTCVRGQVGCVIVQDRRIVASGYNGAPPGEKDCLELGCDVDFTGHTPSGCQRAIHAEANAIAFAARAGVRVEGATMYCTAGPCVKCAQLMISAGITQLRYIRPYRDQRGLDLFQQSQGRLAICHSFKMTEPFGD